MNLPDGMTEAEKPIAKELEIQRASQLRMRQLKGRSQIMASERCKEAQFGGGRTFVSSKIRTLCA